MQYHPDKNTDNPYTAARFIEIQQAYQTLCNTRSRTNYDDERWMAGMDKNVNHHDVVSPAWLLDISKKLNQSLAKMDTHRISQGALAEYILLILSDAHIGVLQQQDEFKNTEIITQIIQATRWLEPKYLSPIINRLSIIAAKTELHSTITKYAIARKREAFREQLFPYIVLVITLALCVVMYFYGR